MLSACLYCSFLALLVAARSLELFLSRRNSAWAFAHGAIELGRSHFGWMRLVHSALCFVCAAEVLVGRRPFLPALGWPMAALALAALSVRGWAIVTLGRRYSLRVIVMPGALPCTNGPYRYLRHPGDLARGIEALAVPLIHTAYLTAALFSLLHAALLAVRIPCEERALAQAHAPVRLPGTRWRCLARRPSRESC